jgi:putative metalloprotease
MLKFAPILAVVAYALLMWWFSSWRLRKELDANSAPLDDPALEAVVRRLGRAVGVPHLKAYVYDIKVFNGLAAPDGRIFITDGVMERYRQNMMSAEEIGSIIAHELGHVALGHSRRRMIDWTGQNALRMVLMMVVGRFIPFLGVWIADFLTRLIAAKLSRTDEFEADAYAAALMRKAGLNGDAQITMFQKLDRMAQAPGGAAWLMSHPQTKERIKAIETLRAGWRQTPAKSAPDRQPN